MKAFLGKYAKDVVNYLLKKYEVDEFYCRAYIRKTEDKFDEEILSNNLDDLDKVYEKYKSIDPRYEISFQSKVLAGGQYKHFPMIDFSNFIIKKIEMNRIKEILNKLGEKYGFILDSGRCLHYYGDRLISDSEWKNFMDKCAKYPEIGKRYISHQLRRGKASLRLITNELKPKNPTVIEILGYKRL